MGKQSKGAEVDGLTGMRSSGPGGTAAAALLAGLQMTLAALITPLVGTLGSPAQGGIYH
jgi:hypothetical protein